MISPPSRNSVCATLLILTAVTGCRFWYKPVPVANAIGEERTTLGGDSVNVHREARFEVYGRNAETVYDGYEQLNRAYRTFERYFGAPAPKLAVVLSDDSVPHIDTGTARAFHDRGFALMRYTRPRSYKNPTRYGALGYGGVMWPIAPTAARKMLALFGQTQLDQNGNVSDAAVLERFPAWFRAAIIHLVGEASSSMTDMELVRERRSSLVPMREMLTLVRTAASDTMLDPSRRSEADEFSLLFAAQASTFARFLVEQEGPAILGRMGRGYLANRSLNEMMAEFRTAPGTVVELERRWKAWVDTREN
jgi:hypothetical protein